MFKPKKNKKMKKTLTKVERPKDDGVGEDNPEHGEDADAVETRQAVVGVARRQHRVQVARQRP